MTWVKALNKVWKCDGAADDVQVQAAIDILPATGGKIEFGPGTFTLDAPLTFATSATSRSFILEGKGIHNTIIQGGAGCADDALIKSEQASWTGFPRFTVRDLNLTGSGVEQYTMYLPYSISDLKNVYFDGSFRGAGNVQMFYQGASGATASPTTWDNVTFAPTSTVTDMVYANAENFSATNVLLSSSSGSATYGLNLVGMSYDFGSLGVFLGGGKSLGAIIKGTGVYVNVSNLYFNYGSYPTTFPYFLYSDAFSHVYFHTIVDNSRLNTARQLYYNATSRKSSAITGIYNVGAHYSSVNRQCDNPGVAYALFTVASGTADAGGDTTHTVDAERTEANDYWNFMWIKYTGGANANLFRLITDFDAATDTITHSAFPNAVLAGDTYVLVPAYMQVDLSDWTYCALQLENCKGNEAGNLKQFCIYNITDGAALSEITAWAGSTNTARMGEWYDLSAHTGSHELALYCLSSSVTEDMITIYGINFLFSGWRYH